MIKNIVKISAILAILLTITACKEEKIKITDTKSISNKIEFAEEIINQLFRAGEQGKVATLTNKKATNDMQSAFEPEKQRELFDAVRQVYGKFKSLEFIEAYKIKDLEATIIRFKGNFTKKDIIPEIRITLDYTMKFNDFAFKPWEDEMK